MKKKLPIIIVALVVLVGGGVFAFTKLKSKSASQEEETSKKKRVSLPTNIIPVEERPYIQITPLADGKNLEIMVDEVKKDSTSVEYELEYQAGSLLQGAFGSISLATLPAKTKILLGSCSAGGACTYHEDVKGGTLLTTFESDEDYALKSRWKYIDNAEGETAFSSQDAKFQIESEDLEDQRYLVIFNTAGYPEGLEGTLNSELYSLTTSSSLTGTADLTIRANEEGDLTIVGWNGKEWTEFKTTSDGKEASAEVELMELYAIIK